MNHTPTPPHMDADIVICGAGPVGLALAAMLLERGKPAAHMTLIDARSAEQSAHDPRAIALSWGSRQLLEPLGAWPAATTAIKQVHVSRRGHFGRTLIDCAQYRLPALGYVLRYGDIVAALEHRIKDSGTRMIRPAVVTDILDQGANASVMLNASSPISTHLVVQAEGGVFAEQAKKSWHRDYHQTAIVAQVNCEAPIPHRAFERFCDEGPLALLPQENGYALVWCTKPDTAHTLLALADQPFLDELNHAFGNRLGRFISISARHAFALGLNVGTGSQKTAQKHRIVIGNAAQTLHPVAGQGLNLGLRDAAVLAHLLGTQHGHPSQYGSAAILAQFAASRRQDRQITIRSTDIMARLFASSPAGSIRQAALGCSLGLIDSLPPVRRLLAEQMMFGWRG